MHMVVVFLNVKKISLTYSEPFMSRQRNYTTDPHSEANPSNAVVSVKTID